MERICALAPNEVRTNHKHRHLLFIFGGDEKIDAGIHSRENNSQRCCDNATFMYYMHCNLSAQTVLRVVVVAQTVNNVADSERHHYSPG